MDAFDKVEELLLAEGYSKEEIPSIMVSIVEQGLSPLEIFGSGIADMLFNNKSKVKPKFTTTQQTGGMLGTRDIKTPGNGLPRQAPKPEFGPNAVKPKVKPPKPLLRPGGVAPKPQFGNPPALSRTTVPPAASSSTPLARPAVTSATSKGVGLFSRLKGVLAPAARFLSNPYVTAASIIGDDIMSRGVADGTLKGKPVRPLEQPKTERPLEQPKPVPRTTVPAPRVPAPTPPTPTPAPPVPKLTTAQQAVNTEYDKLRKSDPAAAVRYGLKMARAGAAKKSFTMPK